MRPVELSRKHRVIALGGAVAALVVTAFLIALPIWRPPPDVKLWELIVISLIGASGIAAGLTLAFSHRLWLVWTGMIMAGLFAAASILTFFSVGIIFLPVAGLLVVLSLVNLRRFRSAQRKVAAS